MEKVQSKYDIYMMRLIPDIYGGKLMKRYNFFMNHVAIEFQGSAKLDKDEKWQKKDFENGYDKMAKAKVSVQCRKQH